MQAWADEQRGGGKSKRNTGSNPKAQVKRFARSR
jgi:hypothetical protein